MCAFIYPHKLYPCYNKCASRRHACILQPGNSAPKSGGSVKENQICKKTSSLKRLSCNACVRVQKRGEWRKLWKKHLEWRIFKTWLPAIRQTALQHTPMISAAVMRMTSHWFWKLIEPMYPVFSISCIVKTGSSSCRDALPVSRRRCHSLIFYRAGSRITAGGEIFRNTCIG